MDDMTRHGTRARGSRNGTHKLDEAQVVEILRLIKENVTQTAIGIMFGVTGGTISAIHRKRSWNHIPRP